jgi:hypothetical protein
MMALGYGFVNALAGCNNLVGREGVAGDPAKLDPTMYLLAAVDILIAARVDLAGRAEFKVIV